MDSIQKQFTFLSLIVKIPVIDSATGKKIGTSIDVVAILREMYPRICALVIRNVRHRKKCYVPWKNVKMVLEGKAIYVENIQSVLEQDFKIPENEVLLKDTFWDKQIVDISGSKVVRVNDLHLLKENNSFWVVHVDVGMTGIIRRLGLTRLVNFIVKLVSSYELKDKLISWKFVHPITSADGTESLSLRVPHSRLRELHPADLADVIVDLGSDEKIAVIKSLDYTMAAHTFQALPLKVRTQIIELLDHEYLVNIVNEMAMDELVDLMLELPRKKRSAVLSRLPQEKVTQITDLLEHSKHIAGSIMNTEFISAKHTATAGMILDKIKKESRKKESIYYVYILDDSDVLVGVVTLRQLLTAAPEKVVSEFMRKRIAKVEVDTNVKDVAEIFYKYDFTIVPVVDKHKHNKMQGIITMKDAFESVFHEIRKETEEIKANI